MTRSLLREIGRLSTNLFFAILLPECMQCESRDLEYPSAVNVTVNTGQVAVWLKHRFVQVNHSLSLKKQNAKN